MAETTNDVLFTPTNDFHIPPEHINFTWRRRLLRWMIRKLLFRTLVKISTEDTELVPQQGGAILMINHTGFLDPIAAAGIVDRDDLVPISKLENFKNPFIAAVIRGWGSASVQRGMADRRALNYAVFALKKGYMVLMSPEGTRNPTLHEARNGMAYVATKANATLVPAAVDGADLFSKRLTRLRRTHVTVRFGRPFRFQCENGDQRVPRETLTKMTSEAMYQLAALLPPHRRGIYSDLRQMSTDYLIFEDDQLR